MQLLLIIVQAIFIYENEQFQQAKNMFRNGNEKGTRIS